jgi:hypothetical protein
MDEFDGSSEQSRVILVLSGLTLSVAMVTICDNFMRLAIIFAFWLQKLAIIFYFQHCLNAVT